MQDLYEKIVGVLCEDHAIREPGRIAKLVMSVINESEHVKPMKIVVHGDSHSDKVDRSIDG
jgi:hypothetical protein